MRRIKLGAALAAITAVAAVTTPGIASAETSQTSTPIKTHGAVMTTVCGTLGGCHQWALGDRWPGRRLGSHFRCRGNPRRRRRCSRLLSATTSAGCPGG